LAAALLLSACAGTPTSPEPGFSEEALRDVDHDLIFATEFPVASKAEAIARADAARSEGELDRALFFYVKALKFDSQDARLLAAIGFLHQFQGNAEYAVRAYTLALKEDPDFAEVLEARGLMLLSNHEDERARIDLTRAVSFNMSAWRSYNGLGLLADRQGNHSLAVTYYDNALAANPGEANILNNRGYSKILVEDFDGAYRDLREATEVVALQEVLSHPEALNKVAEASILNGDNATAERLLKRAIKLSPRYFPAAENNLAQLQLQSDNI
jgi:Flp pilus assembly protein TadD